MYYWYTGSLVEVLRVEVEGAEESARLPSSNPQKSKPRAHNYKTQNTSFHLSRLHTVGESKTSSFSHLRSS
jgi:hypothetical protein